MNPLLSSFNTPFATFPFDLISLEHLREALTQGMIDEKEEISRITQQCEAPTFENTILPFENAGKVLERATTLMYNQLSALHSEDLEKLSEEMSPLLTEHSSDIMLNHELMLRVKAVKEQSDDLDDEEKALVDKVYEAFERSGATLSDADKLIYRDIRKQLSELTLKFSSNLLAETNDYKLHVTDEHDLDGLPPLQVQNALQLAKEQELEGWVFTLHAPSFIPFMSYASNRTLRQQLYTAYNTRCSRLNKHSNIDIVRKIVNLRLQLANVLGYPDYASFVLKRRMAKDSNQVMTFLDDLKSHYLEPARNEVAEVQRFARQYEGDDFVLQPWDFAYYSRWMKQERYHLDPESLRPYFPLPQVIRGVFSLAGRLYGLTFTENASIQVYHPDVKAYEVRDSDGTFLAVFYADFYSRSSKQGGAWMTNYQEQDADHRPHVAIVTNFTPPTAENPSLLTFEEVETFLHEFGHALHGMLSRARFASLSGTNVFWDFVELPSQFMENFAAEPDFLLTFAKHYKTGEPLSDETVQLIRESRQFHAAWACIRQLSFGYLDMSFYMRRESLSPAEDLFRYEADVWHSLQLLPRLSEACMSVQFGHIMSGGYAAGYYSYKWAEVLDADAFAAFQEEGIFNPETAKRFRHCILEKGATAPPEQLYRNFRGHAPTSEALLRRDGICVASSPSLHQN